MRLQQSTEKRAAQAQLITNIQTSENITTRDSILFNDLSQEIKVLFPNITEMRFARMRKTNFQDSIMIQMPTYLVNWKSARTRTAEQPKLQDFIKVRTKLDTFEIINY